MSKMVCLIFLMSSMVSFGQAIKIGVQIWGARNLNFSTFRNGDSIPELKTNDAWQKAGESGKPGWCYFENDPANGLKYGKLYNWYAVIDPRGLCPTGWHVPSDEEFGSIKHQLKNELMQKSDLEVFNGNSLKNITGWSDYAESNQRVCENCKDWSNEYRTQVPCYMCKDTRQIIDPAIIHSGNGNNKSGFSAVPGGYRYDNGSFYDNGKYGIWWSATEHNMRRAWSRLLSYKSETIFRASNEKNFGLSVRCKKD